MSQEFISSDQQREIRYFLTDAVKWAGRIFYDLIQFIFSFIKGMAEMLFPSKR